VIEGDGKQTRDFIFVEDTVRSIVELATLDDPPAPARAADVRRHCADVELAAGAIGPMSTTSLEDGLARTVGWYLRPGAP
jgi:nucleoside-diphosphate-sugar epimerase